MQKKMVQCEDGRRREARVHGEPRQHKAFLVYQAGVRIQGKHVHGEAWFCTTSGIWSFLTLEDAKYGHLLPRCSEEPDSVDGCLIRSPRVKPL